MKKNTNYPLLLTSQFLGAFGDNAILALILGPVMKSFQAGAITAQQQSVANILYTSALFVPYLLLAPLAGYVNDRYPKTYWLIGGNAVKVLGAALAMFSLRGGSYWLGIGYFVVGIGACLYSPAKYGILPEILPQDRLVKANGTVEFLTLVGILVGNLGGAAMVDNLPLPMCYAIVIGIYSTSSFLNFLMSPTPANKEIRLGSSVAEFGIHVRDMFKASRMVKMLVGTSLFWVCGAMMKMNFQPWGQQVLHMTKMLDVALLGLWLSIGVMVGSVLAGQLYKVGELQATRRYGLLLGAAIATLAGTDFFIHHGLTAIRPFAIAMLIVAGVLAGLFLIPLNAGLQAESHQGKLGKTIATQNCLENTAMLAGSVFAYFNVSIGFDPSQLFMALAGLVILVSCFLKFSKLSPATHAQPGH